MVRFSIGPIKTYPPFPLSRPALRALAGALGLTRLLPEAGQSAGHLVASLGDAVPAILPMTVNKSRLLFFAWAAAAPRYARVTIAGWSRLTLAVEESDPDSALATLEALHLGHLPNRSYGDVLCRRQLAAEPSPLTSYPVN